MAAAGEEIEGDTSQTENIMIREKEINKADGGIKKGRKGKVAIVS